MNKNYLSFIQELKQSIIHSRYMAARLANREQIILYLRTGKMLQDKIDNQEWGTNVIEKVAEDLQSELPGIKGFSYRNLRLMRQFYAEYQSIIIWQTVSAKLRDSKENKEISISPTLSAKLLEGIQSPIELSVIMEGFFGISFSHHVHIISKCKNIDERWFYIIQAAKQLWSLSALELHIKNNLFYQQEKISSNFSAALPKEVGINALKVFQDEYLFDFINLDEDASEKVFEGELVSNIKNSIIALGKGFAFLGNQYKLEVGGQDFYIDLLFYNRHLQCLVVFELKKGAFKPEHAGQLNFYLNVLDEKVKLPHENPSIGIVLCKDKNNTVVEFAFKNIEKGMGAATFKTARQVPKEMKGILPDAKDLAELL